ncbi:hypothetical protein [Mycolicibacterium chubuense]|uniref:hypothetical protein n=1 Tax=Mycolicibacterium chubuense TaxID=1800 RepID=UPI000318FFD3|nr:hypothetical protein [Mycolicibacterium chubuense]
MRDRDLIDSELRLVAAVRRTCAEMGDAMPTTVVLDALLDERNAAAAIRLGERDPRRARKLDGASLRAVE